MDNLFELFKKFPGIGARQAKRFVSFVMHASPTYRKELISALTAVHAQVQSCSDCHKKYIHQGLIQGSPVCSICSKVGRDNTILVVVANDADVDVFEHSLSFNGQYYVLGRYIPLFAERIEEYVHLNLLNSRIDRLIAEGLQEVIFATNATADGDYTAKILREYIQKTYGETLKTSTLGRGLATGGELEYADQETLREAMRFRR